MNTVGAYWRRYNLRRPFSRRLRIGTSAICTEEGRRQTIADFHSAPIHHALESSLLFLAYAYGDRQADADSLLRRSGDSGCAERYARLFRETDLRKYIIACFRDHAARDGRLNDTAARLLAEFSRRFDAAAALVPLAKASAEPSHPAPPLRFDQAPLPRKLRLGIVMRKYYYGKDSRLHDLGPRFRTAFAPFDVDCAIIDPVHDPVEFGPRDLIFVDDQYVQRYHCGRDAGRMAEFLAQLRVSGPRVGLIEFDPWTFDFDRVLKGPGEPYDLVWTMAPELAAGGRIRGVPTCLVPFPVGFPRLFDELRVSSTAGAHLPAVSFCGGVEEYNHPRYLWLLSSHAFRSPFAYDVSHHASDGQTVEESIRAYLARLTGAHACLSLTMRANGRSIVVGRAFDALRAGRLLVQEASVDASAYLVPGEHFVEFSSVAELEEICFRLSRENALADVARAGASYFQQHYSDEAVLRHLVTYL